MERIEKLTVYTTAGVLLLAFCGPWSRAASGSDLRSIAVARNSFFATPPQGCEAGTRGCPIFGTWKLNEAESKVAPGTLKNHTVIYEVEGDKVKVTADGVSGDGTPMHNEWTGKFDGKEYPVMGDPNSDARSYRKIDDRTIELTLKKDGKITKKGLIAVSADGKTRTVTITGTDREGRKYKNVAVYDKR
jgi:hypothetical protein